MRTSFRIVLAAAAISFVPLTGAVAQGTAQAPVAKATAQGPVAQATAQGPVAQACADDIGKLCAGKDHGKGEVRTCLESNKAKVSAACKTALDTTGGGQKMQQK